MANASSLTQAQITEAWRPAGIRSFIEIFVSIVPDSQLPGTACRTRVVGEFAPIPFDRLFQAFGERH